MTVFIPFIIFYWAFCTLFLLGAAELDPTHEQIFPKFERLCIRAIIVAFGWIIFPVIIGDRFGNKL